ncbi:uncharacterized protein [Cherax quadricarinatus]|uniref:uncharacterized protein n=1 Tax=Cherax quadricarinatus TaxID=27406 RepID=UPI00387EDAF0
MYRMALMMTLAVVGGTADFIHTDRYQIWAADLKPGFVIRQHSIDGQRCYCKVPWDSSSSVPGSLSSNSSIYRLPSSTPSTSSFGYQILSSPGKALYRAHVVM